MVTHHRCHLCKGGFGTGAHACAHRCFHLRSSFFTWCRLIRDKHFSHHGAVKPHYGPLALCCGATALPDQVGQCRRHMPDNWGRTNPNLHVDNFILGNKDCEIGRSGFQLPNAPKPRNNTSARRTAKPDLVRWSPGPRTRPQRPRSRWQCRATRGADEVRWSLTP